MGTVPVIEELDVSVESVLELVVVDVLFWIGSVVNVDELEDELVSETVEDELVSETVEDELVSETIEDELVSETIGGDVSVAFESFVVELEISGSGEEIVELELVSVEFESAFTRGTVEGKLNAMLLPSNITAIPKLRILSNRLLLSRPNYPGPFLRSHHYKRMIFPKLETIQIYDDFI